MGFRHGPHDVGRSKRQPRYFVVGSLDQPVCLRSGKARSAFRRARWYLRRPPSGDMLSFQVRRAHPTPLAMRLNVLIDGHHVSQSKLTADWLPIKIPLASVLPSEANRGSAWLSGVTAQISACCHNASCSRQHEFAMLAETILPRSRLPVGDSTPCARRLEPSNH
jgi:hypothetical protein